MPKVVKTTDVPTDPKRLYIYLYCDKLGCYKSTTKKKAAKSWLSLSESKRRRFLKTCRLKKDLNNTQRVLSTEPFLKQLYNSTVEDSSRENIKDDEKNETCLDGDNEIENETCSHEQQQNKTCSHEQQQNKTCLDSDNEVRNETFSHEQQNKTSLDGDNELINDTCLNNNKIQQNETSSHEQQQNKKCLGDDNEVRNDTCLDNNSVQQNETCSREQQQNKTSFDGDNEVRNGTCLDNDNDDNNEQNHLIVIVVDESNDNDQQRDIERHLDVNSICKEINGSDAESLPNTDEQRNQETNIGEIDSNNSNNGFINNIKEPIPPIVKNGRELFDVINKDKNIKYQDLNVSDKRIYQVLITKIRKEYIENYIVYLESLSDEQLYEHYLKEC